MCCRLRPRILLPDAASCAISCAMRTARCRCTMLRARCRPGIRNPPGACGSLPQSRAKGTRRAAARGHNATERCLFLTSVPRLTEVGISVPDGPGRARRRGTTTIGTAPDSALTGPIAPPCCDAEHGARQTSVHTQRIAESRRRDVDANQPPQQKSPAAAVSADRGRAMLRIAGFGVGTERKPPRRTPALVPEHARLDPPQLRGWSGIVSR